MIDDDTRDKPDCDTCAVIVLFQPDLDAVGAMVKTLAGEVDALLIYLNSPLASPQKRQLAALSDAAPVTFLGDGGNRGLGTAYNAALAHAASAGARYVLLLDQDSMPPPGMVTRLVAGLDRLVAAGARPAAVGPQPVDAEGVALPSPRPKACTSHAGLDRAGLESVDFLISSGSLVLVANFAAAGPFREDFFIDAIDLEWCFRAWARGLSIWRDAQIAMPHTLGRGPLLKGLGVRMTDQPAFRLHTYIRNQIAMLAMAHVPRAWKLRFLMTLPVRCLLLLARRQFSPAVRMAVIQGIADGWAGRLGSPEDAWRRIRSRS
jgi:rhamnosyltransferase